MKNYALNYIEINRPLVFICGPGISTIHPEKDRRLIIKRYIEDTYRNTGYNYRPMPIIIDEALAATDSIDASFLEEIIASISAQTYILLDTLCSSYEFGQFSNRKNNNQVKAFICDKEEYQGPKIGPYLKNNKNLSIEPYDCLVEKSKFIYFISNTIPIEISEKIDVDLQGYMINKIKVYLKFCHIDNISKAEEDDTIYSYENNALYFYADTKLLFYLMALVIENMPGKFDKISIKDNVFAGFEEIKESIGKILYTSLFVHACNNNKLFNMNIVNEIKIRAKGYTENKNILSKIYALIYFICNSPKDIYGLRNIFGDNEPVPSFIISDLYFYKLICDLTNNDLKVISMYKKRPSRFVSKKCLIIHDKTRSIVTYRNNRYGNLLRDINNKIKDSFETFIPKNVSCFSYTKDLSILDLLSKHLYSQCFIKLDVKKYFDSIRKSTLKKIIKENWDYFVESRKLPIHLLDKKIICSNNSIQPIIDASFYKNKLPIGFTSSPILSNLYLSKLDKIMSKFKYIVYTRYADDILISAKLENFDKLCDAEQKIVRYLSTLSLQTNEKTLRKKLINVGDSFKFLGVNIVKTDGSLNRLTISNDYITKTCKLIGRFMKKQKDYSLQEKVVGRMLYIQSISNDSFNKLIKKIKSKNIDLNTLKDHLPDKLKALVI